MCLKRETPCDYGECPFCAEYFCDCEYWCGADEQILLETDNYLEAVEKYHELEEEKKDELVYLELRQLEFIPTYKRIYI